VLLNEVLDIVDILLISELTAEIANPELNCNPMFSPSFSAVTAQDEGMKPAKSRVQLLQEERNALLATLSPIQRPLWQAGNWILPALPSIYRPLVFPILCVFSTQLLAIIILFFSPMSDRIQWMDFAAAFLVWVVLAGLHIKHLRRVAIE
jgi:hypothetical protein